MPDMLTKNEFLKQYENRLNNGTAQMIQCPFCDSIGVLLVDDKKEYPAKSNGNIQYDRAVKGTTVVWHKQSVDDILKAVMLNDKPMVSLKPSDLGLIQDWEK